MTARKAVAGAVLCAALVGWCAGQEQRKAEPHEPQANAADQQKQQRVRIGQGVTEGMLIHKVQPQYPPAARARGISGSVRMQAIIGKDGRIKDIRLLQGHPLLSDAALDAVRKWRYRPYYLLGEPIEVDTVITVNFTLSGRPKMDSPPAGTPEALGGKLPENGQIVPGMLLHQVSPEYPEEASKQNLSGKVMLRLVVDKKGNVREANPIGGDPVFFDSAVAAAKQWKYTPSTLNGKAIDIVKNVTVRFSQKPQDDQQPE